MIHLIDTGVLLRLLNRADPAHEAVRKCLRTLRGAGDRLAVSPQNIAEFWNVSTRPSSARGGYGLSVAVTEHHLQVIERICDVIPDSPNLYPVWRQLVVINSVKGVQAHDARLVAWMKTQAISQLITFNVDDFSRYQGITAKSPFDY
jgi:predicted nucleic acid-binding protein